MKVSHIFQNLKVERNVKENVGFLLTDNIGGFSFFRNISSSRFEGSFFSDKKRLFKVLEGIELINGRSISQLQNHLSHVERKREGNSESFFMPKGRNSLCYELEKNGEIKVIFDVKDAYDSREWGRYYEIGKVEDIILVTFTKKTDKREDKTDGEKEFTVFTAIAGDVKNFQLIGEWSKRFYEFDYYRHSSPFERFVYEALKLEGKRFVFASSADKETAIREARSVLKDRDLLMKERKDSIKKVSMGTGKRIANKEILMAYICAKNSLAGLTVDSGKDFGIFAGLPWFFQFWTRDEALSLKAMLSNGEEELVKKILLRDLVNIQKDGNIPNRFPSTVTGNADAVGWVFKRVSDLIAKGRISVEKKDTGIKDWLRYSIHGLTSSCTKDGFAYNLPKETWMDTEFKDDGREGVRIEIQAMRMNIYRLMHEISGEKEYYVLEQNLKDKVRENLWNGRWLSDGLDDETIRPNVFIAAYMYQDFLHHDEWVKCFENTLNNIYLPWGGLATIERSSALFRDESTGENPESYHRGDSWFYLNNLAVIAMCRVDKKRFEKYNKKILSASCEEILWKGAVGHHGETSSAKELRSENCSAMAWSAAMFVEMIEEMF